jgi:Tol biopolymer transport system component
MWEIPYPNGTPRRLTDNLNPFSGLSITSDGNTIISVENDFRSGIWVSPNGDVKNARQITSGKGRYPGISWTPDGHLVYATNATGDFELWKMKPDGSAPKQLTNDRLIKDSPVVSPDGRYIVYSAVGEKAGIWRLNADGSNPVELTNGVNEQTPEVSPDSRWVLYTAWTSGKMAIWRVPIEGGAAEQLSTLHSMFGPRVSRDGTRIAVILVQDDTKKVSIAIIPFEGGEPIKEFEVAQTIDMSFSVRWTPDGKGLVYVDGARGFGNLWRQPIDGGRAIRLTEYKENGIWHREWSRDGKQIALVRGEAHSDAIMITNFR